MATLGLPSCTHPPQSAPAHGSRTLDGFFFFLNKYFSRRLVEPKYVIHLFGTRLLCSVLLFFPCKMCSLPKEECSLISTMALRYAETFYSHWQSHTQGQNGSHFLSPKQKLILFLREEPSTTSQKTPGARGKMLELEVS